MYKRFLIVIALGLLATCVGAAFPQTPTIKPTPASESLVSTAKEMVDTQKAVDNALQQARSSLDLSQKALSDSLAAKSKELQDEMKADKKYAAKIKEIETIQQQLKDAGVAADQKFRQTAGPLQQKVAVDKALVNGLIPIVRKESGLPDTASFDPATQTWTDAAKAEKK